MINQQLATLQHNGHEADEPEEPPSVRLSLQMTQVWWTGGDS